MKRRTVHLCFGLLSVCIAGAALERAWQLRQTLALNARIARIVATPVTRDATPAPASAARELQLARALALSQAGLYDAAQQGYAALIRAGAQRDPLARQALFNLGNMYLRQGLAAKGSDALPLFELGKQRLRELLRVAPQDWDARYNLERALRLAPETQEAFSAEQQEPVEQRRVRIPGFVAGDLP
jgi:mxaK protein